MTQPATTPPGGVPGGVPAPYAGHPAAGQRGAAVAQPPGALSGQARPGRPAPVQPGQVASGGLLGGPASSANPLGALLRSAFEGTPGRMRLLGALAAFVLAVFGIVGATTLWSSSAALERADHNTAQVVRVQGIYADLVRADADATNAFLVGGLENPAQRADYDAAMSGVAMGIAEAAKAQPADGTALGALNAQVQTYAATVEQARVYNRQGVPIGAQYLNNASATLRASALPIIDAVTKADTGRANDEFEASQSSVWLDLTGALAVVALLGVLLWLARRTHRYLNVPLAVGAVVAVVALIVGIATLSDVGARVTSVRTSEFANTVALASARSAAYDAKSNESLTLISRGSGGTYEKSWTKQSGTVLTNLAGLQSAPAETSPTTILTKLWKSYVDAHQAIRALDDKGQWDQAVEAAAKTDAGSANQRFTDFDRRATLSLEESRRTTEANVLAPRTQVTITGWALLLVTLGAALLALRGIGQRVEEYR